MRCGDKDNPAGPMFTSLGEPCRNNVTPGTFRCFMHGGSSKASKIKAEQAMAIARMPAIESLAKILQQFHEVTCVTCGYPKGDTDEKRMIAQVSRIILDRSGLGPKAFLELARKGEASLDLELLTLEERDALKTHIAAINEIKALIRQRAGVTPESDPSAPGVH